jgi:NAD+ synthase (glutamine-hydrolysing)
MTFKVGVGICTLNQFALDFTGNLERIVQSLDECLLKKLHIRTGPELEVCGYSCEDAFFEMDTECHSWQVVAEILKLHYPNLIIDLGKSFFNFKNVYYY